MIATQTSTVRASARPFTTARPFARIHCSRQSSVQCLAVSRESASESSSASTSRRAVLGGLASAALLALQPQAAQAAKNPKQVADSLYEALNNGDIAGALVNVGADSVWEFPKSYPKTRYTGTEGFKEYTSYLASKGSTQLTVLDSFVQGDKAVYLLSATVTSKKSGETRTIPLAHYFTVKNGRIATFREYSDSAALLELLA